MNVWKHLKQYSLNLVVLAIASLILEQVIYCGCLPGYFSRMLVSPVFWGLVSVVCSWQLWVTRDNSDPVIAERDENEGDVCWSINPASGYLMCGNTGLDFNGNLYGSNLFGDFLDHENFD